MKYIIKDFRRGIMRAMIALGVITFLSFLYSTTGNVNAQASTAMVENVERQQLYPQTNNEELYCMALNIYHEAKNQPLAGQFAVADVVLNRVQSTNYPSTPCTVIYEGPIKESWKTKQDPNLPENERVYYPRKHKCQFSWYCDGKSDDVVFNDAWEKAQTVAYMIMMQGQYRGITEGATHYHANYVSPNWAPTLQLVGHIGDHIFYRQVK